MLKVSSETQNAQDLWQKVGETVGTALYHKAQTDDKAEKKSKKKRRHKRRGSGDKSVISFFL